MCSPCCSYLIQHPGSCWQDVAQLPIAAKQVLSSNFKMFTSRVVRKQTSQEDGETTKLLIELQDGLKIETVIMHYDTTGMLPFGVFLVFVFWLHIHAGMEELNGV